MDFASPITQQGALLLLAGSCAGLLVAVLLSAHTLIPEQGTAPGRRALAHWLPIAMMVLVASLLGQTGVALGVIFGTSVAALSSVAGFVALSGPVRDVPPMAQRVWSFLPVPALLTFMLGFGGSLGLIEAAALLAQGVLMLLVWREPRIELPEAPFEPAEPEHVPTSLAWLVLELAPILALAAVAAWGASRGAEAMSVTNRLYSEVLVGSTILSVVLILPMVNSGALLASRGQGWAPITAQAGVVFLNLGLLLPLAIVLPVLMGQGTSSAATPARTFFASWLGDHVSRLWDQITYPRVSWRIDALTLLILAMIFVPIAHRRFKLDRWVGFALILAYAFYLLGVMIAGAKGG